MPASENLDDRKGDDGKDCERNHDCNSVMLLINVHRPAYVF
jgi:hypothetical protein